MSVQCQGYTTPFILPEYFLLLLILYNVLLACNEILSLIIETIVIKFITVQEYVLIHVYRLKLTTIFMYYKYMIVIHQTLKKRY